MDLKLAFTSPLFMDNLDLMTRPVSYLTYEVASNDGNKHNVELYFEAGPQWALDQPHQEAVAESFTEGNLLYLKTGSRNQEILGKKGDDVRIDWGYFYMAADKENSSCATGEGKTLRKSFIDGKLTSSKTDGSDKLALVRSLGETKKAEDTCCWVTMTCTLFSISVKIFVRTGIAMETKPFSRSLRKLIRNMMQ